jgi:YD repeat-containing protein
LFSNNLDYSLAGRISQDARIGAGRQYTYDGAGRLTSATDTPSGTVRAYGFDANSNASFSYNAGDQLAGSTYGSGYMYDTYGNLDTYAKTGGGSVNFDYDSYDHTIRICEHRPH